MEKRNFLSLSLSEQQRILAVMNEYLSVLAEIDPRQELKRSAADQHDGIFNWAMAEARRRVDNVISR